MINILIHADAGVGIGLGHLQRCLALASALHVQGIRCTFLGDPEIHCRVAAFQFVGLAQRDIELECEPDYRQTVEIAEFHQCSGIVVDLYKASERYLYDLRAAGFFVIAIDDSARFSFPCHLVINGGVQAESFSYRSSTGDTQFLLGPRYALLRKEFWNLVPRTVNEEVRNVLLIMGGADGRNLMPKLLESLDSLTGDFSVTCIVGPFSGNHAEVEAVAKRCRKRVNLIHDPESVRDLMLESDLAISAAGQTLSELAATGTPTVAIQVAENQAGNLQFMEQHGVISPIRFKNQHQLETDLFATLRQLFTQPERRTEMTANGLPLVDGKGAFRCAKVLVSSLTQICSNPGRVDLAP